MKKRILKGFMNISLLSARIMPQTREMMAFLAIHRPCGVNCAIFSCGSGCAVLIGSCEVKMRKKCALAHKKATWGADASADAHRVLLTNYKYFSSITKNPVNMELL